MPTAMRWKRKWRRKRPSTITLRPPIGPAAITLDERHILAPQQRYAVGERIRRLLSLINARTAEEMRNRLEFLGDWPETSDG